MSHRFRRSAALLVLLLAAATPAMAEKSVPVGKALPYLEAYLKLPAAERTRFAPAYYFRIGAQPMAVPVWLVQGGVRTAMPLNAQGRMERLPTLAQLADGKLTFGVDPAVKFGVRLQIEPTMAPAADLDAHELAAAIAQAATGERKAAGVLARVAPKLKEVGFVGVASGEVEFSDGRKAALPLVDGVPTYSPTALPNARRIRLPKVPDRLELG